MKLVVVAVLTVAVLSSGSVLKSPSDGSFELLILHNNDMHAKFEQTSQSSGTCTSEDREAGKCYGGFPRVAHVVKEARRAAQSGEGPPVLYLNAGDTYTGTAWFTLYKWKIAAEFINALQPDAVALGNNELDKDGKLTPFLENINTQILASNVIIKSAENITVHNSIIFVMQGVKVGVVGYLTPEAKILDSFGYVEYIDEVLALKEEVATLKSLDVNIIIALGHSSPSKDIEIAQEVDGIDLVIAGNKNTFYWNGNTVSDIEKIKFVRQESGKRVPVILSTAYDKYLGSIKMKFDADGEIIEFNDYPILLDSSVTQDVESLKVAEKYHKEIISRSEEVVGNTAVVLDGDSCSVDECNFGNLVADAIMYYYAIRFEGENWTDAPVALIHGGAIAASIAPSNRPAAVTRGELQTALPLASNIVAVTMNGSVLPQVLEHAVADYSQQNPTGQFLQLSGIRVVYDMSQEVGSRVSQVVVRCWSCLVPEFYTIDDWRTYKLLVPAALADGEYGYSMLVGLPREELEFDEVTSVAEYISLRSPVYPEVAGRVVLTNIDSMDVPASASSLSFTMLSLALVFLLMILN